MPGGRRKDQFRIHIRLDPSGANHDLGVWDTFGGGAVDSDELKYKPGGMAPELSLGGQITVNNFTAQKLFDSEHDQNVIKLLIASVGRKEVVGKKQVLDEDGNVFSDGNALVYRGVLKTFTPPEHDSNSNDAAVGIMEVSSAGTVG